MLDFYTSLLVGTLGGLVATLLTVTFRNYWVSVFIPWYEERLYRDAKIEGNWKSEKRKGSSNILFMQIARKSYSVNGTFTYIEGCDQGKTYKFNGEFRNLILTANYSSTISSQLDRGTLALMLVHNGDKLKGILSYYLDPESKISSYELTFDRQK